MLVRKASTVPAFSLVKKAGTKKTREKRKECEGRERGQNPF
jgi:hypothetical protein